MTRWRPRVAVVALALALAGCGGHAPSMLNTHGPEARTVSRVWWLMFVLAAVVYVVVAGFIVVAVLRGRRTGRSRKEPKDDTFVWFGGIVVPVIILGVIAVVTVNTTQALRSAQDGELRIAVVGKRWWWDVSYPDAGGVRTANEIHIPVGRQVDLELTSDNVIHSFWVPQLAGKVDTIPGQVNHLRLTATEPGTYRGQCAEYCGIQHAHMGMVVVAEAPVDFDRWLTRRSTGAGLTPTSDQAARGELVFMREACAGCHAVRGTQAAAQVGPDLSDFGSRESLASNTLANTPENLARWIAEPQSVKPGNLMPPTALSPEDRAAVVAYLEGLK